MQLLSIEVKNFKTFDRLKINNLLGLTVIIGENGIGKSNVFTIIKFIKDALNIGVESYLNNKKSNIEDLLHNKNINNKLEIILSLKHKSSIYTYEVGIEYYNKHSFNIYKELLLDDNQQTIANYLIKSNNLDNNINLCLKNQSTEIEQCICNILDSIQIYNFEKKLKYKNNNIVSHQKIDSLNIDGSNLVDMLYVLYQNYRSNFDVINNVLFMMIPYFKEFIFQQNNESSIQLYVRMLNIDKAITCEKMSSGSMRLFFLATILNLPLSLRPSLLILQEPEIGLHPAVLQMIADLIDAYSKESAVMVSTQSTILLDKLNIDNLYLLKLNSDIHKTDLVNIDTKKISKSLEKYNISDLWIMNILGNLVK